MQFIIVSLLFGKVAFSIFPALVGSYFAEGHKALCKPLRALFASDILHFGSVCLLMCDSGKLYSLGSLSVLTPPVHTVRNATQHGSRSTGCTHLKAATATHEKEQDRFYFYFFLKMNILCCGCRRGTRLRWRAGLFFISTLDKTQSHVPSL